MTPDRSFAPEVMAMNLVPYMRSLQKHDVTFTVTFRLESVQRDGDGLLAIVGSDYGGVRKERRVDQVVVNHGTRPLDELYFELKPQSSNQGAVDYPALIDGQPQAAAGAGHRRVPAVPHRRRGVGAQYACGDLRRAAAGEGPVTRHLHAGPRNLTPASAPPVHRHAAAFPHLFSPLQLRHKTLRNRIVFGAHTANMAEQGIPGARHLGYYLERARGGAAMIVVEPVPVHATAVLTRGNMRHSSDAIIEPLRAHHRRLPRRGRGDAAAALPRRPARRLRQLLFGALVAQSACPRTTTPTAATR